MDLAAGTQLAHYEIRSRIGAGGMGEVYLAEDTKLRRRVALKLLSADLTKDSDRLRRFEQEAQAASALNHPNILVIYEIGTEGDAHFIATEFIEGETLRQHLHRGAQLSIHESLEIATQVASAVSAAHRAGIIHRDIKPENIMIRPDGYVKVLDFGLAKLTEQHSSSIDTEAPTVANANTDPGTVLGTLNYMSPEQARGKTLDARSDIFSLGVVIYEMVAGRAPFEAETSSDVMSFILHKEPPPLARYTPDVPVELDRIVAKALAKDKEDRYQTARDLLIDLKRLKQKQEFDAELERSVSPESISRPPAAATSSGTAVATATEPSVRSDGAAIKTTSSAEYIVSEIRRHKVGALLAMAALVVLTAVGAFFVYPRYVARGAGAIRSIAVLPFANEGGDPAAEYLSDGISENLINSLSQLPQLKVIARSSSFRYKGKEVDVREAAKALGVEALVTGRVVQRGDSLQVSVEVVNAAEGTQMWGERYTRRAADVQTVQSEISREIAERLRVRLTGAQEQQLSKRATDNPEAYQLYLNGEFYRRKGGYENVKRSLDLFKQAVALDPSFAPAWASVAKCYRYLGAAGVFDPKEATPKAKEAALKALGLDESLTEAHEVLGLIKRDEWDWAASEREFRRAIELNPSLSTAHSIYSDYLSNAGRHAEALAEAKRAQELDPLRVNPKGSEGIALYFARRYDEAIQKLQDVIKLEPGYAIPHAYLGYTYAAKGMYREAVEAYQKQMSIEGDTTSTLCFLGYALARSGKQDQAQNILDKLKKTREYVSPAELAILYAGLEDKEGALASLERAYDAHDLQMQFLKVDPHYDSLRGEPRFQDLMRRVGLPQ